MTEFATPQIPFEAAKRVGVVAPLEDSDVANAPITPLVQRMVSDREVSAGNLGD